MNQVGRTSIRACQLCRPDSQGHMVARATTTIAGVRVCEHHEQIIRAIEADTALLEGRA